MLTKCKENLCVCMYVCVSELHSNPHIYFTVSSINVLGACRVVKPAPSSSMPRKEKDLQSALTACWEFQCTVLGMP